MPSPALKYTDDRPPLVLVVDDTSDTRDMFAEYLDFKGYRAQTASDGREAVRRALRTHPSVIVMDLAMPILDGWEATRILHADPRTKDIPTSCRAHTSFEPLRTPRAPAGRKPRTSQPNWWATGSSRAIPVKPAP